MYFHELYNYDNETCYIKFTNNAYKVIQHMTSITQGNLKLLPKKDSNGSKDCLVSQTKFHIRKQHL